MANLRRESGAQRLTFYCVELLQNLFRNIVHPAVVFEQTKSRLTDTNQVASASATWRASSIVGLFLLTETILRANFSISTEYLTSADTDRLKPWRRALCEDRALPSHVFGPVLFLAFSRLAAIFLSLATAVPDAASSMAVAAAPS